MTGPEVMLASASREAPDLVVARLQRDGWLFELKFDGIRAVVDATSAHIRIFNRRGVDMTHRYPDVVEQIRASGLDGVLDGEIIVTSEGGRPEFALAHLRDAQSTERGVRAAMAKAPAAFVAFDVLRDGSEDLRGLPYVDRHDRLLKIFPVEQISLSNGDGTTMWEFVKSRGLEGLVAKRPDAAYRPGRQKSWVKIKLTKRLSALVGGIVPGTGSRADFGSLALYLWDPDAGGLVSLGNVGSGFSEAMIRRIQWLVAQNEPVVVEIEYLEVSANRSLRMPVFKQIRTDLGPEACTVDQLD